MQEKQEDVGRMAGNRDRIDKTNRTNGTRDPDGTTPGFIQPHGGYRELLSYRKAEIVYDATACFCRRFIDKRDRTFDQMIQAARSGKQNILEGSQAAAKDFVEHGGLRERMTQARLERRAQQRHEPRDPREGQ